MPSHAENSATCSEVTDFFAVPGYSVVDLEGPDAVTFAHSQFANDVTALVIGQWQWNCWLNPKGRLLAVFALLRTDVDQLRIVLLDVESQALANDLRRYVFRRKLSIQPRPDLVVAGRFLPPTQAQGQILAALTLPLPALELDFGSPDLPRCLRVQSTPPSAAPDGDAWSVADLRLGLPRLDASQREHWTPQQLGLDRFPAYSVKKGCYPGQEIVARTHFLGKAKREPLLLHVPNHAQPGAEVSQDDRVIGSLASVAGQSPRWGLAVVSLDRSAGALVVEGEPAQASEFQSRPKPG